MVHRYLNNGYYIVLDVNSGSVHNVDKLVYDLLEIYEELSDENKLNQNLIVSKALNSGFKYEMSDDDDNLVPAGEEDIKEAVGEITELIKGGMLYTKDVYENAIEKFLEQPSLVKALCLHIAHDCNLRCKYCFAEEGEYHGRRCLMSYETGKKALDFLVANSGARKNLEVDFFGGEPLMNFKVVKDLVRYGRSIEKENNKRFRFTLTTNGTYLND